MNIKQVAQVCHETNRAYCETIGDYSQKSWDQADLWQIESASKGVRFKLDNPDAPPSAQHNAWADDKIAAGWRFGPVKDARLKTHPCLVPHFLLPVEQRLKDYLFCAVVEAFAKAEAQSGT